MTDWNKILTPELIRKAAHGANLDQRKLVRKAKQLQTINLQLTMPKKEVTKFQKALKANKGMKICIWHKDNLPSTDILLSIIKKLKEENSRLKIQTVKHLTSQCLTLVEEN